MTTRGRYRLYDRRDLVCLGFDEAVAAHLLKRDTAIDARALRRYVSASRQTFALFEHAAEEDPEARRRSITRAQAWRATLDKAEDLRDLGRIDDDPS